ncbi:hypothetical protein EKG83_25820 [Saccharothrix syringae]|uniref:Uncharacterized protein n=2 Tax=Saccharothrix syringae TaxID=103733 RepID=A0A5Q0HF84_SACSY|nr:hypothetical protein EKG83_25820 [Saccharothrix syringae]
MVRPAGDGKWGVVTIERRGTDYRTEPCPRCPWRVDAPLNVFPPQVFRDSARTTYDLATHTFGCHGSSRSAPQTCAGFLLRGASDNLTIRLAVVSGRIDPDSIGSPVELYSDYRAMAVANGVDPNDPALTPCRGDRAMLGIAPGQGSADG